MSSNKTPGAEADADATAMDLSATTSSTSKLTTAAAATATSKAANVDPLRENLVGSLISCPTLAVGPSIHTLSPSTNTGLTIQLQNLTATVNMNIPLKLRTIANKAHNTEYNPKKFGAVVMRLLKPKCTMLLFQSGKCVITGARSVHNASLASRKFGYILSKCGFTPPSIDFKVQNMIGTTDVGFPIRLEGIVFNHAKFASYEPELFPGLIYRMLEPKVVLLIFVSGKVVITGAKQDRDLARAMEKIHPVLEEFKKVKLTEAQQRAAMSAGNKSQSKQPVLQITEKGEKRQRVQATGAPKIIARGKNGGG
ncbi:hypothetical protein TrVE_jg6432 [Triparma verrucosa]|uniref:TATA-box-binding protein n=1 Tax=Triparma verrucosa TaxID=1606542 RepID=A0A9W7CF47_9STRA|nr:hypothetical protein TrVE_jg6432 [Triparma verrucosa]